MERDSHGRHSLHHQSVREILQAAARAGPSASVAGPCKTAAGSTERGTQPGARSRTIGGAERPHSVFHPGNGGVTQSNQSSENPGRFSSAGASGSDWGTHQIRVEMHVWRETSTARYRAQSSPPRLGERAEYTVWSLQRPSTCPGRSCPVVATPPAGRDRSRMARNRRHAFG